MLAYLDAGTGSLLLAAIAGGAAGLAVFLRMTKDRILGMFSSKHREAAKKASEELTGASEQSEQ